MDWIESFCVAFFCGSVWLSYIQLDKSVHIVAVIVMARSSGGSGSRYWSFGIQMSEALITQCFLSLFELRVRWISVCISHMLSIATKHTLREGLYTQQQINPQFSTVAIDWSDQRCHVRQRDCSFYPGDRIALEKSLDRCQNQNNNGLYCVRCSVALCAIQLCQ